MLEVLLGYSQGAKNSYRTMGLCSKDTATKMDLVTVDGAKTWTQRKNTVYQRKQIGRNVWFTAL